MASGVRFNLFFEQLMDAFVFGIVGGGVIPLDEDLMTFGFGEYRQCGDGLIGIGDDSF